LIDFKFRNVSQPLSLEGIRQRLPNRVQILQYAVLNDKLLIWVISKDSFLTVEQSVPAAMVAEKTLGYLQRISKRPEGNKDEALRDGKELYDILIRPVESLIEKDKELCIIPDKTLNYLPFGAIISSSSGKYLLEDYCLEYSPSTSIFVLCSDEAERRERTISETLLSVGNPNFDPNAFPSLSNLPSASREADKITSYYDSWISFTGSQATESRIKEEIQKADVAHFALHSVVDQRSPLHSKLVLAKEPAIQNAAAGQDGLLQAYEIYGLKLPRTRLVVLSACQTGFGPYYGGEGTLNIARPFIVAGVPITVASLWLVDSVSTEELMARFHQHRKIEKLSTAAALRQAQLDMLNGKDESLRQPYYWAPFTVIGGSARF
jgi:CHAT domain-containing protein